VASKSSVGATTSDRFGGDDVEVDAEDMTDEAEDVADAAEWRKGGCDKARCTDRAFSSRARKARLRRGELDRVWLLCDEGEAVYNDSDEEDAAATKSGRGGLLEE